MKTTSLVYQAAKLGYTALHRESIDNDGVKETDTLILKDGETIVTVSSDSKWVMNNDTKGFELLSEDEQDELMEIVLKYLATPKRDR